MARNPNLFRPLCCLVALLGMAPFGRATDQAANAQLAPALPGTASADVLAGALQGILVQMLPGTLYEKATDWGKTARVPNGVKWHGDGLLRRPALQYTSRNDGLWRKVRLKAIDPAHSLVVKISDLQWEKSDRLAFTLAAWVDLGVNLEQQKWNAGVRLYSASVRARLRVKLTMRCEATCRIETTGGVLPDFIFQCRIVRSETAYDHLVVEHVAGIGGTGARWLGELARTTVHELRPTLERKLLDRANAALLRAGSSREVRLGIGSLLADKNKAP